jgi:16S rRNA (uracil1498-N3)-methyltransferase
MQCLIVPGARHIRSTHTGFQMPRFYCPQELFPGAVITLPDHVAHHVNVLRLTAGEHVTLFNGEGGEYTATIAGIEKKRVSAEVKTFSPREAELPYAVTLAQALPEASKMDWIIEKAVELGVHAIQPLAAQRCVVRLSAERAAKRLLHWQGVIVAAAEQSGRNRLPHLAEPVDLNNWIGRQDLHVRILLSPRAEQSLSDWARHHPPQAVALMIGPEGGFTDAEEDIAGAQGVLSLSMGPRVLRTETAGLAALSALNAIWGAM